jgi:uncharacterized protein YbjT (DUF2867 family)
MNRKPKVLVAGATGYLGRYLVQALINQDYPFQALARNQQKLKQLGLADDQYHLAEVTNPRTLKDCCENIDVVISTIGITRQKDDLSFMDVDFQANLNLLEEAERARVKKFIYISAFNAPKYPHVRVLKAKEQFAKRLLRSQQLTPCVIRPNGFFSDMAEIFKMAQNGKIYLFGDGSLRLNPIHGKDLANYCLQAIVRQERELDIGGPEILSLNQIAALAFQAQGKRIKITYLPDWLRKISLFIAAKLPEKLTGSAEFFLNTMAEDMLAPTYGQHHLKTFYEQMSQLQHPPHQE